MPINSIPFAVIIGEDEIASDNFVLKNLGRATFIDFEGLKNSFVNNNQA
jgi:histidyl-tRNA synthetase